MERGYESVSVRDILDEIGGAPGMFYYAADYAGATHVLVRADTSIEDVDYTLRLVYSLGAAD